MEFLGWIFPWMDFSTIFRGNVFSGTQNKEISSNGGTSRQDDEAKDSVDGDMNLIRTREELSYQALKSVLTFMDPNKRFEMAKSIPAIRTMEKIVPLSIDHLCFDYSCRRIEVNERIYTIGIWRDFSGYKISKELQTLNNEGDLEWNAYQGKYARSRYTPKSWTPGDIGIEDLENQTSIDLSSERSLPSPNVPSYLQLSIEESGNSRTLERMILQGDESIHKAMKYFNTRLFGNRKVPIRVRKLQVDKGIPLSPHSGVKFHIKELDVSHFESVENFSIIFNKLEPVITENSFPLDKLSVFFHFGETGEVHPIVRSAKEVEIYLDMDEFQFGRLIHNLPNRIVTFHLNPVDFETILGFMDLWISEGRPLGTTFTFTLFPETYLDLMSEIGERYEMVTQSTRNDCKYINNRDTRKCAQCEDGPGFDNCTIQMRNADHVLLIWTRGEDTLCDFDFLHWTMAVKEKEDTSVL